MLSKCKELIFDRVTKTSGLILNEPLILARPKEFLSLLNHQQIFELLPWKFCATPEPIRPKLNCKKNTNKGSIHMVGIDVANDMTNSTVISDLVKR